MIPFPTASKEDPPGRDVFCPRIPRKTCCSRARICPETSLSILHSPSTRRGRGSARPAVGTVGSVRAEAISTLTGWNSVRGKDDILTNRALSGRSAQYLLSPPRHAHRIERLGLGLTLRTPAGWPGPRQARASRGGYRFPPRAGRGAGARRP